MEAISAALQPYKDIVANAAMVVTIGQFFSGTLICKEIVNAGSTKGHDATPFVGGIVLGIMSMFYGILLNDVTILYVNIAAIILNTAYMACFYLYAEDTNTVMRPLSYGSAIVSIIYAYTKIEYVENLEYRLGLIITIAMFMLIASPLFNIASIIKNRNAETMPMPIIFSGTVVTFLWLLYGIILMNDFMIIQNVVGLILCATQILVYILFRGGVPEKKKGKQKKVE